MSERRHRWAVAFVATVVAGCGAKTGLEIEERDAGLEIDAPRATDASRPRSDAPVDPCEPDPGLPPPVLRYTFDGDLRDTGALGPLHEGEAIEGVELVGGRCGGAVVVGDPGYVRFADTARVLASLDAVTIDVWIREEVATRTGPVFVGCRSALHGFHAYRGVAPARFTICWGAGRPPEGPGGCGGATLDAGVWHRLAFRYEGPGAPFEVYVDGELARSFEPEAADYDLFGATVNDLFVGSDPESPGGARSRISIDELRVYDVALDPAELAP